MHIFTVLTSWKEIESVLLPNLIKARKEPGSNVVSRDYLKKDSSVSTNEEDGNASTEYITTITNEDRNTNIYEQPHTYSVFHDISTRLNHPIHKCTTPTSTLNTLHYLFHHMKCGIFIMIRNSQLRIFCPFVNTDYTNTWSHQLRLEGDGSFDTYYTQKDGRYRPEDIVEKSHWWANGTIICNEQDRQKQHWGDHFLAALRDMIGEACRCREMPDCEFFLNKRDYPQLKYNVQKKVLVEPYGFLYDKDDRDAEQDVPLPKDRVYKTYAPVVSFYGSSNDRFVDVPWPSSEDWEAAIGLVFPHTFMHKKDQNGVAVFDSKPRDLFTDVNFQQFERTWEDDRRNTAFFRGTATGGGVTIETNQRLKLAHLSHSWEQEPTTQGLLDAKLVGWNVRDKKIATSAMTFVRPDTFQFDAGKHHYTPIYEQSNYKYLIYVDGHCAACRYGFMMRLGCVILKVESIQVADRMWYFPMLKPYVDHVPVRADLGDLQEKIVWCRENDDKCKEIAECAKQFYEKYVAKEALLDYLQMTCRQMAVRYIQPPSWWEMPTRKEDPPMLRRPEAPCHEDKGNYVQNRGKNHPKRKKGKGRLCVRCEQDFKEEEQALIIVKEEMELVKKQSKMSKEKLRARMKRLAASEV